MRRLAQQFLDLLRKRAWLRTHNKGPGRLPIKLTLESLEDRLVPTTSLNQVLPAAVAGTVWLDSNHNNLVDANEALLPGATVGLSGTDSQGHAVKTSVVTDVNG